jgi:hypothetical protein
VIGEVVVIGFGVVESTKSCSVDRKALVEDLVDRKLEWQMVDRAVFKKLLEIRMIDKERVRKRRRAEPYTR